MGIYPNRQRARRLNSDDAPDPVEKGDGGDEVNPENVELDYSSVVEKHNDEQEAEEQRRELAKGLGGSSDGLDFEEVGKGDREIPDLSDYDYSGIAKSSEETEREKNAAAIGEAVADELAARGLAGDEVADADADASSTDEGSVEKAGERTADLLTDLQDDLRQMKRVESFKRLAKDYYAAGGSPEDTLPEMLDWYNRHSDGPAVKVEDGSVELVEDAAT